MEDIFESKSYIDKVLSFAYNGRSKKTVFIDRLCGEFESYCFTFTFPFKMYWKIFNEI